MTSHMFYSLRSSCYGLQMNFYLASCVILMVLTKRIEGVICNGSNTVTIEATDERQTIKSPNYPNRYLNNELCKWALVTYSEFKVIRFRMIRAEITPSATCGDDYVSTQDGEHNWSPGIKSWCGSITNSDEYTSYAATVSVTFRADNTKTDMGFELEFWTVPKTFIEFKPVEQSTAHFALYGLFGAIVSSIVISNIIIVFVRKSDWFKENLSKNREINDEDDTLEFSVKEKGPVEKTPVIKVDIKADIKTTVPKDFYKRTSPAQENDNNSPPSVSV